ncbi:MAG TPA: NAD(P)H-dependent oxidoreductase [Bacteroidales bacterium]|nr:NAD(P)H-dependent oxidoreductase [Bacteroidales bacterium]
MSLLDHLQWRYATKKYDPTRKVSQADVDQIVEAIRLAPTSSGLQQFRLLVITNQQLKDQMVSIAFDQQIVADCSHLLVFAAWDRYTEERIVSMYDYITIEREQPADRFTAYTDRLKAKYLPQSAQENFEHTARQAYIGLGLAMAQAAELKVDCTPMEGFDNAKLDELLDLHSKGLRSVLLLPIGYRDEDGDWLLKMKKVRKPVDEFVTVIK